MHERKMTMARLSEGFLALPGGIGTLEELFEIYTWSQLQLTHHPVAILNIENYFGKMIGFLDHMVAEGFLNKDIRNLLIVDDNARHLIYNMKNYTKPSTRDKIDKT